MPPKKEKRETKAKSAKTKQRSKLVDEVATGEMSKEQLEEDIVRLQEDIVRIHEELDQERKERNYFQMEQEKTRSFWEITRRQLDEKNSELRYKEREMKEAEELHQVEIRGLWSSTQIEVIKTMLNTPDSEICSVSFSNPALYITASSVFHAQPVFNVETELLKELDIASKLMVFLFSFFTGLAFASMIYLGYIALVDRMRSAPVVCLPSADASPQNT